jgi:4-hydroxy 2-oxovalerate aldolase
MRNVLIIDSTLRDGNHAVRHQLNKKQISAYALAAETAKIPVLMVGHGNGLGASSLQVGESLLLDSEIIITARENIKKTKLGVFSIPGFATINKDLKNALDLGADVVCVACHCTEADITKRHIEYSRGRNKQVYGILMMSHMAPKEILAEEGLKMESYGALGVILMDSAGALLPKDVTEKIRALADKLKIPVGFHAHNNLGLGIANSIAAVESGAAILDCCTRGFGAGAGNAQLEVIVPVLEKMGYSTGIDLYKVLDLSDLAEETIMEYIPITRSNTIVSGLAGVFSGFAKHVERISSQYGVDPRDVFFELGRRKPVGGQEDLIVEVAINLSDKKRQQIGSKK